MSESCMQNKMEEMLIFLQTCTTQELGRIVLEISHIRPLVGFVLGEELAFDCESISIIDDAIHVILNPKETF